MLFDAVKLNKNADIYKYKYFGYGIQFDSGGTFFNNISKIFGVDMSSSVHVNNKKKYILIPVEGPTQKLDDRKLTVEKNIQLILLMLEKKFV